MSRICPAVLPLMALETPRDTARQCAMILLKGLEVLIAKGDDNFKRDELVPMLCRCFDKAQQNPQVLTAVLDAAPLWARDHVIEFSSLGSRPVQRQRERLS